MNQLTQLFLAHLIAVGTLAQKTAEWIETTSSGNADDTTETVQFMAHLGNELQDFVKAVDLGAAALAYRRHIECPE